MITAPLKSPARPSQTSSVNPFAAALAETEKSTYQSEQHAQAPINPFSEALSKTGGALPDFDQYTNKPQENSARQQAADLEKRKKEMAHEKMRQMLHNRINPNPEAMQSVFDAKAKKVEEEIEQLRQEVNLLVRDVKKFAQTIDIETNKAFVNQGIEGKGARSWLQHVRLFIFLIRQRVRDAGSWATQLHSKKSKKHSKTGPGLEISGEQHEKTSTVHDMMNNEVSSMYNGN